MKKIAFICMGNTCRSPMAECVFKHICKINNDASFKVSSYGLTAVNGENINEKAKKILKKYKIKYTSHKAKKLTDTILKKYDYAFAVTDDIKNILKKYDNTYSIKNFIDGIDIPDPYGLGESEYEVVFKLIYASCKKIYEKLKVNNENSVM